MCARSPESQPCPGLHQEKYGQRVDGGDSAPLLCSGETRPGVLHPALDVAVEQQLLPVLEYLITEVLPLLLIGWALGSGGSVLEPADIGSVGHRGSFHQLLTEATSVAPSLPKPCHASPIQMVSGAWEAFGKESKTKRNEVVARGCWSLLPSN